MTTTNSPKMTMEQRIRLAHMAHLMDINREAKSMRGTSGNQKRTLRIALWASLEYESVRKSS